MDLQIGQSFTVLKAFTSPAGVPKSKYIEGGVYRVTAMNKDYVSDNIDAGNAKLGTPDPSVARRLNAGAATMNGIATVK